MFRRLADQLARRGVAPQQRVDLLVDFIRIGDRIAKLSAQEAAAAPDDRMEVVRAVTTAGAERRRLHQALFAGARPAGAIPGPAEVSAAAARSEAERAWRAWYTPGSDNDPERRAELERRYGPVPWSVLVDP